MAKGKEFLGDKMAEMAVEGGTPIALRTLTGACGGQGWEPCFWLRLRGTPSKYFERQYGSLVNQP